jgi:hypothetical protein
MTVNISQPESSGWLIPYELFTSLNIKIKQNEKAISKKAISFHYSDDVFHVFFACTMQGQQGAYVSQERIPLWSKVCSR